MKRNYVLWLYAAVGLSSFWKRLIGWLEMFPQAAAVNASINIVTIKNNFDAHFAEPINYKRPM